ncbi:extracellular solute-binding protein [Marinicrinis lubricantis]|uniref:Extracellular solute-binding protein n=1 Tax=Marinicrinis lubricantis TaxID=2086470 RepID=A0ABW1IJD7_9BACL
MIKKGMLLFTALILMLSIVTACSGGNNGNGGNNGGANSGNSETNGNSSSNGGDAKAEEPMKISIMLPAFNTELPDDDSPVIQKLEEYTNTDIEVQFVPNSSYPDKMNITLSSGQMPTLMVADKTPSFINAARSGAFWDVTDYLDDYPNLSMANPVVLNNSSIDGRNYGVYRTRTLGRMGVTINKDWMEAVGMDAPKTIDEFYELLKAFKEQDPDQDGKDDTYGIVITKYAGPWDIMQVWFGAPNGWGEDENGNLVPAHETPEYMEALKFFRKLYDEGLVNSDFAVMDSAVWMDPMVNEEAGVIVDVADISRRIDGRMQEKAERDESYMDVFQAPVGPKGHRDMPTTGYSSMLAISKSTVKTEEELKRVLEFLDKLNDQEMQMLLSYGIEGRHYELVDGHVNPLTTPDDVALVSELESLNQMLMFIPNDRLIPLEQTDINKKIEEVYQANEDIVVGNPAQPLVSEVYALKGQQLDNIIADARIQYIVGQINEDQLQDQFKLWRENGGDDYVAEINELYQAAKGN